ncbi:hypothetical protein LX36DRAFT_430937 [Colletotrichum falcatum]|nr:hypothetical protein LX36DRAFT_430937 [Colletotrichum falcatum]
MGDAPECRKPVDEVILNTLHGRAHARYNVAGPGRQTNRAREGWYTTYVRIWIPTKGMVVFFRTPPSIAIRLSKPGGGSMLPMDARANLLTDALWRVHKQVRRIAPTNWPGIHTYEYLVHSYPVLRRAILASWCCWRYLCQSVQKGSSHRQTVGRDCHALPRETSIEFRTASSVNAGV